MTSDNSTPELREIWKKEQEIEDKNKPFCDDILKTAQSRQVRRAMEREMEKIGTTEFIEKYKLLTEVDKSNKEK